MGPAQDDADDIYAEEHCARCGVCCGALDGHPCEHLRRDAQAYYCEIYGQHRGFHHTVDGLPFRCVSIREIIEAVGGYECCAYVQALRARAGRGQERARLGAAP